MEKMKDRMVSSQMVMKYSISTRRGKEQRSRIGLYREHKMAACTNSRICVSFYTINLSRIRACRVLPHRTTITRLTIKRLHFATAAFIALTLLSSSKLDGQIASSASRTDPAASQFRISAANVSWNGPQPLHTERTTLRDIPPPCSITPRIDTVDYAYVVIDTSTRYRTMDGWGASSNCHEENPVRFDPATRMRLFDLVYGELGANIICIRLYSSFQASKGGPYT